VSNTLYRDYSQWILAMEPKLGWSRLTRPQFRFMASRVLGLFVLLAFVLVVRMQVIKNGYGTVELRLERDRLLSLKKQNEKKLMELQSLATVEELARKDMGMVEINPNQVIYLDDPSKAQLGRKAWKAIFGD
jgi:hypothetical protein